MKKLLTTLALALSLLFGGTVALAAPANADDCTVVAGTCAPAPCTMVAGQCAPDPCTPVAGMCPGAARDMAVLEQTANDYRAQVVALTSELAASDARADRLQARVDRQSATIHRLRAKIRSLR